MKMMYETREQAAYAYITQQSQDLFFLSRDGRILKANESARTLTKCLENVTAFSDIVMDFVGTFNFTGLVQTQELPHLLNIKTTTGLPQSYDFFLSRDNTLSWPLAGWMPGK
ncbi:MAG: hypothetical protein R6U16_02025 [Desulfotignum sp.]